MTDQTPPLSQANPATWRSCCSFLLVPLVIIAIPICLFFAWIYGVPDDISRWVRSLEYPAIEARYKSVADQIATATSDIFIDEVHSIGQPRLMTHDDYTGVVTGNVIKVFGTDRSFDAVLDDYTRYFSSRSDWKVEKGGFELARN